VITTEEAALRAELILEYPADDPERGWELDEFPQGWLINWHRWQGHPGQFSFVIERETGLARYFITVRPQQIIDEYEAVRERGHPDDPWTGPATPLLALDPGEEISSWPRIPVPRPAT
jgi:hypothetical protein